jgi:hypothetical protein
VGSSALCSPWSVQAHEQGDKDSKDQLDHLRRNHGKPPQKIPAPLAPHGPSTPTSPFSGDLTLGDGEPKGFSL